MISFNVRAQGKTCNLSADGAPSRAGCERRLSVILSGAKDLQFLLENKQMQILRFAQDDSRGDFLRSLLM